MIIWKRPYVQTSDTRVHTKKNIYAETDIMVIAFITCISTSGNADQPQMGTRKAKEMASRPSCYERMDNSATHQAPDAVDHEVNTIGMCEMDSRADTCCYGNNCRLLSTTGQLCDVKGFTIHTRQSPMHQWVDPQHQ